MMFGVRACPLRRGAAAGSRSFAAAWRVTRMRTCVRACASSDLRQGRLRAILQLDRAALDLAVAELPDHFQHLGPRGVHALVDLLVRLDGHAELELLVGHLAFLGGLAVVAAAASRAAAALEAGRVAPVADAPLRTVVARLVAAGLAPVEPRAAVNDALPPVRAFSG